MLAVNDKEIDGLPCSICFDHVDNSLAICVSSTHSSRCQLVQQRPCHVLSCLCYNPCKRSLTLCCKNRALCFVNRRLSVLFVAVILHINNKIDRFSYWTKLTTIQLQHFNILGCIPNEYNNCSIHYMALMTLQIGQTTTSSAAGPVAALFFIGGFIPWVNWKVLLMKLFSCLKIQ